MTRDLRNGTHPRVGNGGTDRLFSDEMSAADKPVKKFGARAAGFTIYGYILVILGVLALDFTPRFFQGDSISYLTTGNGWIPPDRSWAFGYLVSFLMRHGNGFVAYLIMQAILLGILAAATQIFFRDFRRWRAAYAICAIIICCDPVVELYTRFFMTDFASCFCFIVFLCALHPVLNPRAGTRALAAGLLVALLATIAAVFLRVAYALIIELTVGITLVIAFRQLGAARKLLLGGVGLMAPAAVGLLIFANGFVFAQRFPHQMFANKLSGVFLAAVFAPALQPVDFQRAGITITPAEFQSLQLWSYEKRGDQVWGTAQNDLTPFLQSKLHITNFYSQQLNSKAAQLVRNALLRDPLALAAVYLNSGAPYLNPRQWHARVGQEMDLSRLLPADFVAFFNSYSSRKITTAATTQPSPLIRLYLKLSYFYPAQLALGLAAGLFLLWREHFRPAVVLLFAAFAADIAAAPLYSNYLIARYILAAIVIDYILVMLAINLLYDARQRRLSREPICGSDNNG